MRKALLFFYSLFSCSIILKAQCDAAFTWSANQGQVSFAAADTSGTIRHSWQFGDGVSDIFSTTPVHNYNFSGQYMVLHTIRDSINNCVDSSLQSVRLDFSPTCSVNLTYVKPSALSGQYIFFSQVSISGSVLQDIEWTIDGTSISTQERLDHIFTQAGVYEVCVRARAVSGCIAQKCYTINYQPYTKCNTGVSFTHTAEPIQTRQINFTALPGQPQSIYTWSYGDGGTGLGRNVSHIYSHSGTYQVGLIVTDSLNYCVDSLSETIQVDELPSESCTASFTYLLNQQGQASYTATSSQTITSQIWKIISADSANAVVLNTTDLVYNFDNAGSYYVCLAVTTSTGCTASHCETVVIHSVSGGRPVVVPTYPNPVSGEAFVRLNIDMKKADLIKYKVCNLAGTIVYQLQKHGQAGANTITIPVQQLVKGQYFIDILFGDQQRRTVFQKL
ncbi:MAG: PKD domain-containing protein [Chitinophagaceae bacterium]